MPTVTATGGEALRLESLDISALASAAVTSSSPTALTLHNAGLDETYSFTGSFIGRDDAGIPTGGVINSFMLSVGGHQIASITDAALSVATLRTDVGSGNLSGLLSELFSGDDTLTGLDSSGQGFGDNISGYAGDDSIQAKAGADTLFGGDGNDVLEGGTGADLIYGGAGQADIASYIHATAAVKIDLSQTFQDAGVEGQDQLYGIEGVLGSSFADTLVASNYGSGLFGAGGADQLIGGGGTDYLYGGGGDDTVVGTPGGDVIDGGDGFDTLDYSLSTAPVILQLGSSSASGAPGLTSIEGLVGGSAADRLTGASASERLVGGGGADILQGGDGSDTLAGGAGSDALDGGAGVDTATYAGFAHDYAMALNGGAGTVSGGREGGTDTLTSIENVQFLDGTLTFDDHSTAAQIVRLYDSFLGRAPDAAGFESYLRLAQAGYSFQQLADLAAGGTEFHNATAGLTDSQYVTYVYEHSLHREPDPQGLQNYVTDLENGTFTRTSMIVFAAEGAEHVALTAPVVAQGLWVPDEKVEGLELLYDASVQRQPDAFGLSAYAAEFAAGTTFRQIANQMAAGAEFQAAHAGQDDAAYVDSLYVAEVGRHADAFGLAAYTAELANGHTRGDILYETAMGQEHQSHVLAYYDPLLVNA